jgi:hypothetical protein
LSGLVEGQREVALQRLARLRSVTGQGERRDKGRVNVPDVIRIDRDCLERSKPGEDAILISARKPRVADDIGYQDAASFRVSAMLPSPNAEDSTATKGSARRGADGADRATRAVFCDQPAPLWP